MDWFLHDRDHRHERVSLFYVTSLLLQPLKASENLCFIFSGGKEIALREVFISGVFLFRTFFHLDWIRKDTEHLSVFSPNAGKYGPEKLEIRILFTQCRKVARNGLTALYLGKYLSCYVDRLQMRTRRRKIWIYLKW